jgi:hypothetical protein
VTTKQGVDTIPAVTLRALALVIFLRLSLVEASADLALELNEVKMPCFELS